MTAFEKMEAQGLKPVSEDSSEISFECNYFPMRITFVKNQPVIVIEDTGDIVRISPFDIDAMYSVCKEIGWLD